MAEQSVAEQSAAALTASSTVAELEADAAEREQLVASLQAQMASLKASSSGDETVLVEARTRVSELECEKVC